MGFFRSLIGWLFIIGGFFRVIIGLGLLFFGGLTFAQFDPVSSTIFTGELTGFLSILGVVYILLGAFFIWLGNVIRNSGRQIIRI